MNNVCILLLVFANQPIERLSTQQQPLDAFRRFKILHFFSLSLLHFMRQRFPSKLECPLMWSKVRL